MDNLTHTVAGLLVAEALLQSPIGRRAPAGFRLAAQLCSALANNLPDFDFLYAQRGLDYLLHHRGHTHTLLLGVPLGLLALVPVWLMRRRREPWARRWWLYLAGLSLLGPLVHLALDFSNNYGVHPFWPIDNRWFFGDAVFIVEPWFLMTALPVLAATAATRAGRIVHVVLIGLLLVLAVVSGMVPRGIVLALIVWAALVGVVARRGAPPVTVGAAIAVCVAICAAWFGSSAHVHGRMVEALARHFPRYATEDIVITPQPANPFCYGALSVQRDARRYVVRRASVALWPSFRAAADCLSDDSPTAPLAPVPAPSTRDLVWRGQFEAPLAELRALAARDCRAAAFLRWSRVPFWTRDVIGDLRYDRSAGLDFSEVPLSSPAGPCPDRVPSWHPPRAELLP